MTKAVFRLTNEETRRLFLERQGLARPLQGPFSTDDLYELIHQLGYVQLDSINTVERAHHMILHSRADGYRHKHLRQLHEDDARLFEHWTHDACLIPTEFYPHWKHRFKATAAKRHEPRWKNRLGPEPDKVIRAVRKRIRDEGPAMSRDFEDKGKGPWWGWGPSKTALEYLWYTGELAIARREGFQKVYDLSERTVPDMHRTATTSRAATIDWKCREALARLGVATSGELAAYWAGVSPAEAATWVKSQLGQDVIPVELENADGSLRKSVAFAELEGDVEKLATPPKRLRFLSPFDPVMRDRKRALRLFDFDYRVEIFVPEAKRTYGYYVLPILEGTNLTGRADLKAHRAEDRLEMKGLWLEPGIRLTHAREAGIRKALARLAKFTGVGTVDADAALQRAKAHPARGR